MSASLRKLRATVFAFADQGSAGQPDMVYLIIPSSAVDQAWWCARSLPTGREVTTGMKPEHRVDAVLNLSAACPIEQNGAVVLEKGTTREETFMVRAVLRRDYGRDELQVLAERVTELVLTTT